MTARASLTIGSLNVWGRWADWPRRRTALRSAWPRRGPDVLLLQEARVDAAGNQAEEVGDLLDYPCRAWVAGHDAEDGSEGLAILGRVELRDVRSEQLPASTPPRRVLLADVALGDRAVTVACGHTVAAPEAARRRQLAALLAIDGASLVLGADLNEPPETVRPLLRAAGLDDVLAGDRSATWPMCRATFGQAWLSQLGRAPHFSLEPRRIDFLLARGVRAADAGVEGLRGHDGTDASDHALVWGRFAP